MESWNIYIDNDDEPTLSDEMKDLGGEDSVNCSMPEIRIENEVCQT